MGLCWNNDVYVDVGVEFGFKMGARACQMCTDVITLHYTNVNYLDDYIGVAKNSQAESHFLSLVNMLEYVGLPINQKKLKSPSSVVNCLGTILMKKNRYIKNF